MLGESRNNDGILWIQEGTIPMTHPVYAVASMKLNLPGTAGLTSKHQTRVPDLPIL